MISMACFFVVVLGGRSGLLDLEFAPNNSGSGSESGMMLKSEPDLRRAVPLLA